MEKLQNKKGRRLSIVTLLLSFVISCSSSDNGQLDSNESVNPGLSGKVFIGNRFGPWVLDLKTGRYTPIAGTDWESNPAYPGLAKFSAYPLLYSGKGYVETIETCELEFGNNKDCIVFHDGDGSITGQFQLPDVTFGPARLSRDGQFVALIVENTDHEIGKPFFILKVFNRNGEDVGGVNQNEIRRHDFDWLPNNQIIYVSEQSIYASNKIGPLITIPENQGIPGEPSVSPDGSQITFVIGDRTSTGVKGTVWIANIDGSGLRQLTTENEGITWHRSPFWSPDGKWIFVTDGTTTKSPAYVVPPGAEKVLLTQESSTVAKPVLSYFLETIVSPSSTDPIPLSSQFGVKSGSLAWLAE